jgi:flagellar basal body-associated protein FliL
VDKDKINIHTMQIKHIIDNLIDDTMKRYLQRAFSYWGIEGTEQKIKEVYSKMPEIRNRFLKIYYNLFK